MMIPQNPRPIDLKRGDLVAFKHGELYLPGIVDDDDVENPIREIRVHDGCLSEFASNLVPVDDETFTMLIALLQMGIEVDLDPAV